MSKHAAKHGYAAFAPEDVEDASRRRPAVSLEGYAASWGLEFKGRGGLAGFRGALPAFDDYAFNLLRGVLPGGRFGILYHELLHTHRDGGSSMPGTFHAVRTGSAGGLLSGLIPNRTDIPVLGNFLDPPTAKGDLEPFEAGGAWSPVTTAATLVPETVAGVGALTLTVRHRTPGLDARHNLDLTRFGLAGWRGVVPDRLDDVRLAGLLSPAVVAALAPLTTLPFAQVRVDRGTVTVRRNGYLADPAALDAFAATLCAVADGLRDASLAALPPAADVARPLPDWPYAHTGDEVVAPGLPAAWANDIRGFAARRALTLEDPAAWHAGFPSASIPGEALAVGRDPASSRRVLFLSEIPLVDSRAVRAAVVAPSDPTTAPTPPGGEVDLAARTVRTVAPGLTARWSMDWFGYASEADGFVDRALAAS
jgi:hypothetical protein